MKRVTPYFVLLAAILASFAFLPNAHAGQLAVYWDAPGGNTDGTPLQDLVGYRIYFGFGSTGAYAPPCNSNYIDVPNQTGYSLHGLPDGALAYVQVTARDAYGHESGCSNEAAAMTAAIPAQAAPTDSPGGNPLDTGH